MYLSEASWGGGTKGQEWVRRELGAKRSKKEGSVPVPRHIFMWWRWGEPPSKIPLWERACVRVNARVSVFNVSLFHFPMFMFELLPLGIFEYFIRFLGGRFHVLSLKSKIISVLYVASVRGFQVFQCSMFEILLGAQALYAVKHFQSLSS